MPRVIKNAAAITDWIDELIEHTEAGNSKQSKLEAELLLDDFGRLVHLVSDNNNHSNSADPVFADGLEGFDVGQIRRVARGIQRGRAASENEQIVQALASFRDARKHWMAAQPKPMTKRGE